MKKLVLGSLVATSLAGTAFAAFSLGDNANVVLNADGSVRYDSNILQQPAGPTKVKATIFELDPGISISNAKAAAVQANLTYTEDLTRYDNHSNLNTNLAVIDYTSSYKDSANIADFNVGYHQLNQDTPLAGAPGLLRHNETVGDGGDEFTVNPSLKLGFDASYDYTKYLAAGLANSTVYSLPLTAYWAYNPKLDYTAGVRYRKTDLSDQPSYTDIYYNVGMKGTFNEKLTGSFSVGVNQHRGSTTALSDGNSTSVGADSSFQWQESDVTLITFGLSNDFGAASSGQEQQTLAANAGIREQLSKQLTGIVNLGYNIINYSGPRVDDYWTSTFGLTYEISKTWSASATYEFQNNASNQTGSSFADNTVTFKVSLRF
jgi:hypothetical protein